MGTCWTRKAPNIRNMKAVCERVSDWQRKKERKKGRKKNNNKKLYTVLSYLSVFTFCTCCKISNLSRVYC